ncbi:conserved Plasmodium protein, unknown function [Plasmodium vinckei vinckei]|uniref:Uncharacterized protein n=1 Tax=Plasmodium vinckei vinckei TaxID=54757 RepID=A0A081IAH2_PLAVN|nr:conserved Plasmodium protein, unknown function [Plasmodium vinckei vinckei]KEG00680.1 hypothetical protein YYE_04511 [Plasmodium vinckei vinckei]VEV54628.1 conserved Plasmodium protein, unknown function [Plasmodium vinckei vinckei]
MKPESLSLEQTEQSAEPSRDHFYGQKNNSCEFQGFTKDIENEGKLCDELDATRDDSEIDETIICKRNTDLEINDVKINNIHANNRQESDIKNEGDAMYIAELIHVEKDNNNLSNDKKEEEDSVENKQIHPETICDNNYKKMNVHNLRDEIADTTEGSKEKKEKILDEKRNDQNINQESIINKTQCKVSHSENDSNKDRDRNNNGFTKSGSNNSSCIKSDMEKKSRTNAPMNKQNSNINYKMTRWEKENEKFKELYKNDKHTNITIYKRIYQSYIFLKKEYNELINENRKKLRTNKKLKYELDNLKNDNYYSNYFLNNDSENILEDLASGISNIFKWMDIENKIGQKNYDNAVSVFKKGSNSIGSDSKNVIKTGLEKKQNVIKTDLEKKQDENSEQKKEEMPNKSNLNEESNKKLPDEECNKIDEIEKCENQITLNNEIIKKETEGNTINIDSVEIKDKKDFSMDIEGIKKNGILKLELIKSTIINNLVPNYIYNDLNNEHSTNLISKKNKVEPTQDDKITSIDNAHIDNITYSNKEEEDNINIINGEHLNLLNPEYLVGNLSNIINNFRNSKNVKDANNIDEKNDSKGEQMNEIDKSENNRPIEYCNSNEKKVGPKPFIIKEGQNKNSCKLSNIVNDNKIQKNSFLWEKENILKKKNIKYAKHAPIKIEKGEQYFLKNKNKVEKFAITNNINNENIIDYLKTKLYIKNKNEKIEKVGTRYCENIHGGGNKIIEHITFKDNNTSYRYANKACLKNYNKKNHTHSNTLNELSYCKEGTYFVSKIIVNNKNRNNKDIEKESIFHISNYKENKYTPINLSVFFPVDDKKKSNLDSELSINHLKKNMRFILKKANKKKKKNPQTNTISTDQVNNNMTNSGLETNGAPGMILKNLNVPQKEIKKKKKLYDFKNSKGNVDEWKYFTGKLKRRFNLNMLNKKILKNKSRNRKISIYKMEESINYTISSQIFNNFYKHIKHYPKCIYQLVKKQKTTTTNNNCDSTQKQITYLCLFKRCTKESWHYYKLYNTYFVKEMKKKTKNEIRKVENNEKTEQIEVNTNNKNELSNIDKELNKIEGKENEKTNLEKQSDEEEKGTLGSPDESTVLDINDDMLEEYIFKEAEAEAEPVSSTVSPSVSPEFTEALKKHVLSLNILDRQINKIEYKSDNEDIIIIGVKIYLGDKYTLLFVYALNSIEYSVKKWIENNIDQIKLYIKKYNSKILKFFKTYSINMFTFFCNFLSIIENYIQEFPFYFSISFDDLIMESLICI